MFRKKILLHSCCGPCLTLPEEVLREDYEITSYFYNPNIYPLEEYQRRKDELVNYTSLKGIKLIVEAPDFEEWTKLIQGLESEKEGGLRCWKCYQYRLEKTAQYAKDNNYEIFTTVLSVSPHKNSAKINEIGKKLEKEYNIEFLEADFKKQEGFKKSLILSKKYKLYRQNYCGCKYSIRKEN